jgi:hypothetical protein
MLRLDPPPLDLKVRCLFEEDLQTLEFPKVKEFLFRCNRQTPLEVAAKALARKNGNDWQQYNFSFISSKGDQEQKILDLSIRFDSILKGPESGLTELNLFYRIKR